MSERIELKDEALELVDGGNFDYDPSTKLCGPNGNYAYRYEDKAAMKAWINEHARGFDPATRDDDVINGLLAAELIFPL